MILKRNFSSFRELFNNDLELEIIQQEIFLFIQDNLQGLEFDLKLNRDLNSFNDLNGLLSNIFSGTNSSELHYAIGNTSHIYHTLLIGYFYQLINKSENELVPEFVKTISINLNSGDLSIDVPLSRSFLKLSWDARQVFDQIILGFFDRLSVSLLGAKSKQVTFDSKGIKIIIAEPLGSSAEIINSIESTRYNFIQLCNLLNPKEETTLISRITKLLIRDIGFSLEEISTHLNTSKRSIQRELKMQGKSFLMLKEETRQILLKSYIKKGIHKIDELADLLAYSERSSFEKAYKKWYGTTISKDLKDESLID